MNETELRLLSKEIIPLQAKIELLEELQKDGGVDYLERLDELYCKIRELRKEYFKLL